MRIIIFSIFITLSACTQIDQFVDARIGAMKFNLMSPYEKTQLIEQAIKEECKDSRTRRKCEADLREMVIQRLEMQTSGPSLADYSRNIQNSAY